jgi:hypothetical protein
MKIAPKHFAHPLFIYLSGIYPVLEATGINHEAPLFCAETGSSAPSIPDTPAPGQRMVCADSKSVDSLHPRETNSIKSSLIFVNVRSNISAHNRQQG